MTAFGSRICAASALSVAAVLAGCGSVPTAPLTEREEAAQSPPPAISQPRRGGGYYKDDGPGDNPPDLDRIADAEPRVEPLHRFANNPYSVFGVAYTPMKSHAPYKQRGLASWYGRMFHGQRTASGEPYDMYAMTGAHTTLPIPSYVRVTSVRSGRYVIVRINDRGPFHAGRLIDLSYAAAHKLGIVTQGSALVEVELLTPDEIVRMNDGATTLSAASEGSVYLQLGAFSARANAESLRARIVRELSELKESAVQILQRDGAFRVHVGPYRSRTDAAPVAQSIRDLFQIAPLFVTR